MRASLRTGLKVTSCKDKEPSLPMDARKGLIESILVSQYSMQLRLVAEKDDDDDDDDEELMLRKLNNM